MQVVKQRLGKVTYKGERVYLEDPALSKIGMVEGSTYNTDIDYEKNRIELYTSNEGNKVSAKIKKTKDNGEKKVIPVIDRAGADIRRALSKCIAIQITFYKDDNGGRIEIVGIKDTGSIVRDSARDQKFGVLSCGSLFAGGGVGTECFRKAGFQEVFGCEYNPSGDGATDKYANIYSLNHPDSIMFNIPAAMLNAELIPKVGVWICTPPCTDYSALSSTKKESDSVHEFMYILKLLWGMKKENRPTTIVVENVVNFSKSGGKCIELALQDEGYNVHSTVINPICFGGRTSRKRYYMVATVFEGFTFPTPTGRKTTPISEDGVITPESLNFVTKEEDATLRHFIERNATIKHNHKIRAFDVTKDTYIGTIVKNHWKKIPENLIKHPTQEGTYAFLTEEKHMKYLHGIDDEYYLGDSKRTYIEVVGQGVDCSVFYRIAKRIYDFLYEKIFGIKEEYKDLPIFQYLVSAV